MIDTIAGAEASAIVYSLSETAKANNLKPYDYFEYLLTEIPKHMDDTDRSFLEDLLPWSPKLPDNCRKNKQEEPFLTRLLLLSIYRLWCVYFTEILAECSHWEYFFKLQ